MLRALAVSASAIGLTVTLLVAPAIAGHKPNHNPGTGGGGGNATYEITLTDVSNGVVASGNAVEGAGGTIDGLTDEPGGFDKIALGSISTQGGASSVQADYNEECGDVTVVGSLETINNIRVVPNPEIVELHVVVEYSIGDESFVLLLVGNLPEVFPPSGASMDYPLTTWGNRGGGKGKNNRCGIGAQVLDGVTLTINPTSP